MKKRKMDRSYFIASLVVVVLSLAVGYAVFAESLNVSGTAQTTGTFDVEFFATSITSSDLCTPTSVISGDKNTLTIDVPDLQAPGATATINVTVKNVGNLPAELLSVDVTGDADPNITVDYPTWPTAVNLDAGATYNFDIVVTWNPTSSTPNHSLNFTATLNYEQGI